MVRVSRARPNLTKCSLCFSSHLPQAGRHTPLRPQGRLWLQKTRCIKPLLTKCRSQIILNNTVVSQNEGWTGNSVQWRSTEEQVPVGTKIKIRITDSEGQMVVSDATRVVPADDSREEYAGRYEPMYDHGMDDPNSEKDTKDRKTFGLEFGLGPGGMTLGIGRGPAKSSATPTSEAGAEEPMPTGQPDWDARWVAPDRTDFFARCGSC